MAKIGVRSGEGLRGLVGNLVFYSYNGVQCVRTLPRKKAKNSWTERQLLARKRFAAVKEFWGRFDNSPVQGIWKSAVKGRRGDNLFLSVNMPAFGSDGTLTDPERLHFSAGELPLPLRFAAARSQVDLSLLEVTWQDDPGSALAWDDDELMMMVGHEPEFTGPVATGAKREQEAAVIPIPTVPGTVHGVYLFFASEDRKRWSVDQYFGI